LSGDEIVFDEVRYREPAKATRPDRDRRYCCQSYLFPSSLDPPIFVDRRTIDQIERHALSDTSVELGGVLLGKECLDAETGEPFVWVTQSLEAKHYANTQASFTYTHDSWEEMTRDRDRNFPDLDIVGWYHTHPNFGIFLSHHDIFIHQHFFSQPLQVAYVVDPVNQSRGFFQWREGAMVQLGGFFLVGGRGERLLLARQINDLENLGNSENSNVGGFSPRLEAEMIRMLSRPANPSPASSQAERAQAAILYSLLGGVVGIVGLTIAFWLVQIGEQVRQQGENLGRLTRVTEEASVRQRVALDLVAGQPEGEKSPKLVDRYATALKDRDELARRIESQETINRTLAVRTKELESRLGEQSVVLEAARSNLEKQEKDLRDVPRLRERIANLEETVQSQKSLLDQRAPVVDLEERTRSRPLLEQLAQSRIFAYLGWGLSCILAIALIGVWVMKRRAGSEFLDVPNPRKIF